MHLGHCASTRGTCGYSKPHGKAKSPLGIRHYRDLATRASVAGSRRASMWKHPYRRLSRGKVTSPFSALWMSASNSCATNPQSGSKDAPRIRCPFPFSLRVGHRSRPDPSSRIPRRQQPSHRRFPAPQSLSRLPAREAPIGDRGGEHSPRLSEGRVLQAARPPYGFALGLRPRHPGRHRRSECRLRRVPQYGPRRRAPL